MSSLHSLTAWRYFIAFAESGHMNDVANRFDLNVSTISRSIRQLEKSLGQSLVKGNTKKLELTETGVTSYRLMKPVIEQFDRVLGEIHTIEPVVAGVIRLSVAGGFAGTYLLDCLERFNRMYPQVKFNVFSGLKIPALRSGACDLVTVTGRPKDNDVICIYRGTNHYVAVASVDFLKQFNRRIKDPADLSGLRVFAYSGPEREPTRYLVKNRSQRQLVDFGQCLYTDSISAIKQAVLDGKGVAIDLPLIHCYKEMISGQMIPILHGWHKADEELFTVVDKIAWHKPRVRIFAQWFSEESRAYYRNVFESCKNLLKR